MLRLIKGGSRHYPPPEASRGLCGEIKDALEESAGAGKETTAPFATPQSCKDVWEIHRESRKMSFLHLIAGKLSWSQDVKREIHKGRLVALSALVWLADDRWESFVDLVRFFRLESQEHLAFEDVNVDVQASDNRNLETVEKIEGILLADGRRRKTVYEIRTAIERVQQIFYPAQITPIGDTTRVLPRRRLPVLSRSRICPTDGSTRGKVVDRVRVAKGYLHPHTESLIAVKSAVGVGLMKEKLALTKLMACESRPDSIMVCLGAVRIGDEFSIISELAICDLAMILYQQVDDDSRKKLPPQDELKGSSYLLSGSLDIARGLHWLHHKIPPLNNQPRECFHLDLKPGNILVFGDDESWIWKITDFGEASICVHEEDASYGEDTPSTREIRGADMYLPPEAEDRHVGRACDIWSFGCILLEILAYACEPQNGVQELQNLRKQARNASNTQMPGAFYGRESETGNPVFKQELIDRFENSTVSGTPWLPPFKTTLFKLLQVDKSKRPSATDVMGELEALFEQFGRDGYSLLQPSGSRTQTLDSPTTDSMLSSIEKKSTPVWMKKYTSAMEAKKCIIADSGQWLVHKNSECISSLPLGKTALWEDTEGQLQPRLEGRQRLAMVKFISISGNFLAVLCTSGPKGDYNITVHHLGQGAKPRTISVKYQSSPIGLSVSFDGLLLVHFMNHVWLHAPGSSASFDSYKKDFGDSELRAACFSGDSKHVYAWAAEDHETKGKKTRSRLWYVWKIANLGSESSSDFLTYEKPWENDGFGPNHVPCSDVMVPLNGTPYRFDKNVPDGGIVLLHFMSFDRSGNITLVYSRSDILYSHQLKDRITGVYQACAWLQEHKPKIILVRRNPSSGFKVFCVQQFDIPAPTIPPKTPKAEIKFTDVQMLTSLVEDYKGENIGFVLNVSATGSMAYVFGMEGGKTVVKKAKLL